MTTSGDIRPFTDYVAELRSKAERFRKWAVEETNPHWVPHYLSEAERFDKLALDAERRK